jgi:hypothetical protein
LARAIASRNAVTGVTTRISIIQPRDRDNDAIHAVDDKRRQEKKNIAEARGETFSSISVT